ncbi:hypothetical protein IV203_018074 [Nitzschia inconspicua]|uniref:Uncharacterized protein n=1 Tax=Nitzschia inconspicua TaxID=303405 RepID=A0A9K3M175_9STRA|nr:hypothetical protein IV203_018074 [Nitzschia inconspicua]
MRQSRHYGTEMSLKDQNGWLTCFPGHDTCQYSYLGFYKFSRVLTRLMVRRSGDFDNEAGEGDNEDDENRSYDDDCDDDSEMGDDVGRAASRTCCFKDGCE